MESDHHRELLRQIVAAYDRLTVARSTRVPGAQTDANRALSAAVAKARDAVHGQPWGTVAAGRSA